jgi:heptosyltransferase I
VNILIVKLSALGDVTHTLPALTTIRRAHPTAHIAWLVEATAAPLVLDHPALDQVLVWPRRQFTGALRSGHWFHALRLLRDFVRELRSVRYDLVLDFQALLKSAVWVALARGGRKVGFGRGMARSEGSHLFLNERVPAVSMEIHALDRGLMLLEAIGIPRGPVVYDLPITAEARHRANDLLAAAGIDPDQPYVVLHPMTRWPTKQWYPARWAAVADALCEQGCPVVFTGAPEDQECVDEVFRCLKGPAARLDGKLDLKTLAAVFQRAAVVVSTDTGPMHISAAVNTPVVAVFGPTAPNRTGPYGSWHRVVRSGVACSPCFSRRCRSSVAEEMACMKRVEAVELIRAVRERLQLGTAGSSRGSPPSGREVSSV